jgi:Flp pilus assembly pilin Flp
VVEYALIFVLVVIAALLALTAFGTKTGNSMDTIRNTIT